MSTKWFTNWDFNFDLSYGGVELSYRDYQIEYLVVITEPIKQALDIVENINSSRIAPRYNIVGSRGYGKSTLLNYLTYILYKKIFDLSVAPVFCKGIELSEGTDFNTAFFRSLLTSIFWIPEDAKRFYGEKAASFESLQKIKEAEHQYKELLIKHGGHVSLEFIREALDNQLNRLSKEFQRVVFLIDGMDKHEKNEVLSFLRKSQETINMFINTYRCVFFFAADPSWLETLGTREFSGIRGTVIQLREWMVPEVRKLIEKRIGQKGLPVPPIDDAALEVIAQECGGNPREILQNVTDILNYAAREKLSTIGPGIVKDTIWSPLTKSQFQQKILEKAPLRYAFEKLKEIAHRDDKESFNILIATYKEKRLLRDLNYSQRSSQGITLSDEDFRRKVDELLASGCLEIGKTPNFLILSSDLKEMFEYVNIELKRSLATLPSVLREFSFEIPPPIPPEDIRLRDEIKRALEHHPEEWFKYDQLVRRILENPIKRDELKKKYGDRFEEKLEKTCPLVISKLKGERLLLMDKEKGAFRWRGMYIDEETAPYLIFREDIEELEKAKRDLNQERAPQAVEHCKKALNQAFSRLRKLIGEEEQDEVINFVKEKKLDLTEPVSVLTLLETSVHDTETAKWYFNTTLLFVRKIHGFLDENMERGPELQIEYKEYKKSLNASAYQHLYELENKLRELIVNVLGKSENWWDSEAIPNDVREKANQRKATDEKPWPWLEKGDFEPIFYVDFADYAKIISKNWQTVFKEIFEDRQEIMLKLKELDPIRNAIAHSRPLKTNEAKKLELYKDEIVNHIRRWLSRASNS
jgi:exonuclease VII small subunit